ncbi:MAG: Gfo/Idh/MocA family oxidoreductase [Armatimonadetes bacterium]|nr:Gfo/Idh/MocA family oxidoreductase [Armatimonadota bacterium]MDW8122870.1 Gfo/Idh/MocA family oxidoreductase [Armatimonadota bacterium]
MGVYLDEPNFRMVGRRKMPHYDDQSPKRETRKGKVREKMKERIRLGYVGAGFMAQKVHLPNFLSLPHCEVVALAEARSDLGRRVAERFGIRRLYRSHRELLEDDEVEAVAVSAHFAAQGEIARDALRSGRPVFMEKPMAVSLEQADEILEASQQGKAPLMVAYMKRYDAGYRLAREWVLKWKESGEKGRLTLVRVHYFGGDWICGLDTPFETSAEPIPPPPERLPAWLPKEFGSRFVGFLQQYVHAFNFVRWLVGTGSEALVSCCDLDEDGLTGVVIWRSGPHRVLLETGSIDFHRWDEHTQVYFEKGWVQTWSPPLLLRSQPAEVEVYEGGGDYQYRRLLPKERWSWAYKKEAEHFIHCLLSGEPFESPGEDARTDIALCEQVYQQWLKGRGIL